MNTTKKTGHSKMKNSQSELLKTWDYPIAGTDPSELFFEKGKVIGVPVKVMRTGQAEPDEGWHIAEIHYKAAGKDKKQTYVKVLKPSPEDNSRGLQKVLPLKSLETLNPQIKLLLYESEKDYVLYEDSEHGFKIGLIIDIDLEEDTLLIMLGPEGEDITAPLDRIKAADVIDKSTDPRKLEETFHAEVKKRLAAAPDSEGRQPHRRVGERKNLIYYLKVTDTKPNQPIGHAVDISDHGFMLTAGMPIEPNVLFQLKLLLPAEMHGSWHLDFSATSRWCRADENPGFYSVGFQFSDMTPEGAGIIGKLIEKYCF